MTPGPSENLVVAIVLVAPVLWTLTAHLAGLSPSETVEYGALVAMLIGVVTGLWILVDTLREGSA